MAVKFTVLGEPFGKQRPRHNRRTNITYTPNETRQHEQQIAWAYNRQVGAFRFPKDACISMKVTAYMPIPKSASKKRHELMLSGAIRPTVKPDWDNIGKLVADALNGVAYDDDKCIVDAQVRKFYSETPRTVVVLETEENENGKM